MTPEELQAKFDQRRAAGAVDSPPPAQPVRIAPDVGATRTTECDCGVTFAQTCMAFTEEREVWLPVKCGACLERLRGEVGASTADARAVVAAEKLDVPTRYSSATLESFELHGPESEREKQARCVRLARRYLSGWPAVPDVVVFSGGYGTGKGHVAWSMARWLANTGKRVTLVKLPDLIRDLREAWKHEGGLSEAARLGRYRLAALLIIDEVSRHAFYGEPRQHLYDIIDHRIEWQRPTILTTNETGPALAELVGPAVTSRVAGSAGIWDFGAHDYRAHARQKPAA